MNTKQAEVLKATLDEIYGGTCPHNPGHKTLGGCVGSVISPLGNLRRQPIRVPTGDANAQAELFWCAEHNFPMLRYGDNSTRCMWELVVELVSHECRPILVQDALKEAEASRSQPPPRAP